MSKKRKSSTRKLKNRIWFKTYGRAKYIPCYWKCGRMLLFDEATVDHEPPLAEGGKWHNAVLACYTCNHRRGKETNKRIDSKFGVRMKRNEELFWITINTKNNLSKFLMQCWWHEFTGLLTSQNDNRGDWYGSV